MIGNFSFVFFSFLFLYYMHFLLAYYVIQVLLYKNIHLALGL